MRSERGSRPGRAVNLTLANLVQSAADLADSVGGRVLVAITGAPGAGKSTVAEALVTQLGSRAVLVPMDGFHLSQQLLEHLGRADRKGAPDTFDAAGLGHLLVRIRAEDEAAVYFPVFDRSIEEPIAAGGVVEAAHDIVVVEGNYLLLDDPAWSGLRGLFDQTWHLAVDAELRMRRLVDRHIAFGRTPQEAADWSREVDEPNARLIESSAVRADLIVSVA